MFVPYTAFKNYVESIGIQHLVRYVFADSIYYLSIKDAGVELNCEIRDDETANVSDFEANIKTLANSKFKLQHVALPDPDGFSFDGQRTHKGTATNETKTVDFVLPADRYITGVIVKGFNTHWEDTVKFSAIIPVGHAFNPTQNEVVADTFSPAWAVCDETQHIEVYRSKIYAGLIIRAEYTTSSTTPVNFWINTFLHEKTI